MKSLIVKKFLVPILIVVTIPYTAQLIVTELHESVGTLGLQLITITAILAITSIAYLKTKQTIRKIQH